MLEGDEQSKFSQQK